MKLKFSRQIFEKYSNIKFHENPSNGSRVVPYGDEGKNSFSQFCGKRLNANQLMLYREIIAVCSQIHTKHINTLCGQNVEFVNVKLVVHIVTTGLQRVKTLISKSLPMLHAFVHTFITSKFFRCMSQHYNQMSTNTPNSNSNEALATISK